MTLKKQLFNIFPLFIIVGGLFVYNFINAQWVGPTASPTNNNIAAPINVGTVLQTKAGDLVVNTIAAVTEVRSDYYCDALGLNCIFQPDINRFYTRTLIQTNRASGILGGQKVTAQCNSEGSIESGNGASSHYVMTGGGCRVIGVYNELATDEGDVFSYPSYGATSNIWNCENKNLASSTIEASVVCMEIFVGAPGGA